MEGLGFPEAPDATAMECTGGEDPSAEGEVADTSLRQRGKKRPAPKLDGMNLARYMVPKVANSELAGPKLITIDDIVTMQDAGCYVRQNKEFIPKALEGRVYQMMFKLTQQQARALAKFYDVKTKFNRAGKTVNESAQMVQYELERHVVAELESLPRLAATSSAASSSRDVVRVAELSGDAPTTAAGELEAARGLKQTPRNVEELVAALCLEESWFMTPFGGAWTRCTWEDSSVVANVCGIFSPCASTSNIRQCLWGPGKPRLSY